MMVMETTNRSTMETSDITNDDMKHKKKTNDIIYISLNEIPDTLKKSKIYKILSDTHKNNPQIPILREVYERESILSNFMNLSYVIQKLSSSIDTSYIPPDVNYEFVIKNKDILLPHLINMVKQFPQLKYIQEITLLLTVPREKLLKKILKYEHIHLLNYCIKNDLLDLK